MAQMAVKSAVRNFKLRCGNSKTLARKRIDPNSSINVSLHILLKQILQSTSKIQKDSFLKKEDF